MPWPMVIEEHAILSSGETVVTMHRDSVVCNVLVVDNAPVLISRTTGNSPESDRRFYACVAGEDIPDGFNIYYGSVSILSRSKGKFSKRNVHIFGLL